MKKILLFLTVALPFSLAAQIGLTEPGDLVTCAAFGNATFDLTVQEPVVLDGLNPDDYTISYHQSQAAANSNDNAIDNPSSYFSFNGSGTIYIRVEENANPANYETTNFDFLANPTPNIYDQTYETCDFDNTPSDGLTMIDLEALSEQIWGTSGIMPNAMEITFYATEQDAENQANGLESPFVNTSQNQVIYARGSFYETGCTTVIFVTLNVIDCEGECIEPTALNVSNITADSATISWTPSGNETEWEILVLYAGGPFPLPTMQGDIVDINPVLVSGLECPESYSIYVRAVCGASLSNYVGPLTFSTNCENSNPIDLGGCADGGTTCFDLTVNDSYVLGALDPFDYEVSYYASQSAANTGTNAIADPSNYCISVASSTVYARLESYDTGSFEVFPFTVSAQDVITGTSPLQALTQCDDDGDGVAIFDLMVAGMQIDSDNALAYYTSQADALASENPIFDYVTFEAAVGSSTTIHIREDVEGSCDVIYTVQLNAMANCNQSNLCAGANSLCNALGVPFTNTTGVFEAQPGNDYGCLGSTPNPTWFYLPVSGAGTINLLIEQSSDIEFSDNDLDADFIAYGPFTDPTEACGQLDAEHIVSCSYSADFEEQVSIIGAQPGEFYLVMVTNYTDEPGYIRISEMGSSQGEIDCTGFRLNAFLDTNGNSVKDSGEAGFPLGQFHYERNGDGVEHNITAPDGTHRLYDINENNSYDISFTIDPLYAANYTLATSSYANISVEAGEGLQDYNFPVTTILAYSDIAVSIIPDEAPQPGFTYSNTIMYSNLGNQAASGTITFTKDELVTILGISESGAVENTAGFTYNFTNLAPFQTETISINMQVPVIPTVSLGDLLTNSVAITELSGELSLENNVSVSTQEIIGSFDPNDKMESRGEKILISDFGSDDYMYYTIRFENTGTAPAINIRISDMLDASLDETTVKMISASHNYTLDRIDNQLTWRFENVLLPPTMNDPVGSHGYVHFAVKPSAGFGVGDVIPNTASIFFDFNPAIVTNTFNSEFVETLAAPSFTKKGFAVYPNPANDHVTVTMDGSQIIASVIIYDMLGKTIMTRKASGTSEERLDVSALSPGIYLMEVKDTDGISESKKLIVR